MYGSYSAVVSSVWMKFIFPAAAELNNFPGNIKANGVGTLLSNMYLEVPVSKLTKEDPGWLYEYLMGAAANLQYTIVPEELNGVGIKEIANDMFHAGIVLVAISDPVNVHPHPILSTDETLRTGDLAMILSYHERIYVTGAFHLVALRYTRNELKHTNAYDRNSSQAPRSVDDYLTDEGPNSGKPPSSTGPVSQSTAPTRGASMSEFLSPTALPTPSTSRLWMSPSLHNIRVNISADDLDALAEADEQEGDEANQSLSTPAPDIPDSSTAVTSRPYIPDNIKGHVIIAVEGSAPLQNLLLLLRNLWHKDKRNSMRQKKCDRIVVIHPQVGDEVRKRFSRFEGVSLFFIEGSPSSRASWRRAKLNTGKMTCSFCEGVTFKTIEGKELKCPACDNQKTITCSACFGTCKQIKMTDN